MTPSPAPSPTTETVGQLISSITGLLTKRNVHKLAGTALGMYGLVATNVKDLSIGAAYAAIMHIVGGLKKLPD